MDLVFLVYYYRKFDNKQKSQKKVLKNIKIKNQNRVFNGQEICRGKASNFSVKDYKYILYIQAYNYSYRIPA